MRYRTKVRITALVLATSIRLLVPIVPEVVDRAHTVLEILAYPVTGRESFADNCALVASFGLLEIWSCLFDWSDHTREWRKVSLARNLALTRRYEEAESLLSRCKQDGAWGAEPAGVWEYLARNYEEDGSLSDAERCFKRQVEIAEYGERYAGKPPLSYELSRLGLFYMRRERFQDAQTVFKRAVAVEHAAINAAGYGTESRGPAAPGAHSHECTQSCEPGQPLPSWSRLPELLFYLADCYEKMHRTAEADHVRRKLARLGCDVILPAY